MNKPEILQNLMTAFGVDTTEALQQHLTKTDLNDEAQLLHAASVVWSYETVGRYVVKDREAIRRIVDAQSPEQQRKLSIDAKHGFGYYDATQDR